MNKSIINISQLVLIFSILFSITACEDLFKDPLKDKDSGEQITVLLLDRNFIDTKIQFWFVDAETGESIENELIEMQIWGESVDKLITFAGEKPDVFSTEIGYLELGYDPNYKVSKEKPLSITIMAVAESGISAPQFLSYTQEGTKDVMVYINRIIPGGALKSGVYGEPYDIYFNDELNSADLNFLSDISSSPTGTAYEYISLYNALGSGTILCNNLQDEMLYDDFGVYYTSFVSEDVVPPAAPVRSDELYQGDFVFSSVLPSGRARCDLGLTIILDKALGAPGTGSFEYLITYANGSTKTGQISGSFPIEVLIEPLYYLESDPSVQVELFGDTQYDITSGIVNLSSPCGETASFMANPKSNLHTYKFVTQYICPDNPIGYALTINGQFKQDGSTDPWTSFEFIEGVCELELVPDSDYEFRVPIDGEFQSYVLPTDPDQLETFLQENQGEDYTIRELTITPGDDKTEVVAVVEVSENICDKLNGSGDKR